jgi:hypothetical protein
MKPAANRGVLWAGVLLGPTAWLADLGLSYAMIPARHGTGTLGMRLAVAAVALVLALAGGALSLRSWRRLRGQDPHDDGNGRLFLAAFGAAASAFFALVIVATAIPNFLLRPNQTPSENQSATP